MNFHPSVYPLIWVQAVGATIILSSAPFSNSSGIPQPFEVVNASIVAKHESPKLDCWRMPNGSFYLWGLLERPNSSQYLWGWTQIPSKRCSFPPLVTMVLYLFIFELLTADCGHRWAQTLSSAPSLPTKHHVDVLVRVSSKKKFGLSNYWVHLLTKIKICWEHRELVSFSRLGRKCSRFNEWMASLLQLFRGWLVSRHRGVSGKTNKIWILKKLNTNHIHPTGSVSKDGF